MTREGLLLSVGRLIESAQHPLIGLRARVGGEGTQVDGRCYWDAAAFALAATACASYKRRSKERVHRVSDPPVRLDMLQPCKRHI